VPQAYISAWKEHQSIRHPPIRRPVQRPFQRNDLQERECTETNLLQRDQLIIRLLIACLGIGENILVYLYAKYWSLVPQQMISKLLLLGLIAAIVLGMPYVQITIYKLAAVRHRIDGYLIPAIMVIQSLLAVSIMAHLIKSQQ
jgi:hypothetical protein